MAFSWRLGALSATIAVSAMGYRVVRGAMGNVDLAQCHRMSWRPVEAHVRDQDFLPPLSGMRPEVRNQAGKQEGHGRMEDRRGRPEASCHDQVHERIPGSS